MKSSTRGGDVVDFSGTFDGRSFSQRCDASTGTFQNMEWISGGRQYLFIQCRNVDYWINLTVSFDEGRDSQIVGQTGVHGGKTLYADVNIYDAGDSSCNIGGLYEAAITPTAWSPESKQWVGSFTGRCDDGSLSHDVSGTFDAEL